MLGGAINDLQDGVSRSMKQCSSNRPIGQPTIIFRYKISARSPSPSADLSGKYQRLISTFSFLRSTFVS